MQLRIQINGKGSVIQIVLTPSGADTAAHGDESEALDSKLVLYDDGIDRQRQKGEEFDGIEGQDIFRSIDTKPEEDAGSIHDPITDRDVKYVFPRGEYADDVGLFVENLLTSGYVLERCRRGFSIDYPVRKGGFQVTVGWIAPPGIATGPGARDITLGVWNHQNEVPQVVTEHIKIFLVAYTGFMGEFAPIGQQARGVHLPPASFLKCQWDAQTLLSGLSHELTEIAETGIG